MNKYIIAWALSTIFTPPLAFIALRDVYVVSLLACLAFVGGFYAVVIYDWKRQLEEENE